MKKNTVIEMEYSEFEELVQKVYGRKWSFVADQKMRNDSAWTSAVEKDELDEWEVADMKAFKEGKKSEWMAHTLLKDLANNGHLEIGDYVIEVYW